MNTRINRFFDAWYQPECKMAREDWLFVGILTWASIVAFGVGLAIGSLWAYFL